MAETPPSLHQLQEWFFQNITSSTNDSQVDWLASTAKMEASERLAIYRHAYTVRLIECLGEEFEICRETIGAEAFRHMAVEYLEKFPPQTESLSDLGAAFPKYLTQTRPHKQGSEPDWADFVIDLATLERTYAEVFDGPGSETTPPIDFERLLAINPSQWERAQFRFNPSLRLLSLNFPVHEHASRIKNGERPDPPQSMMTKLIVSRNQYIVRRESVTSLEFHLLRSLGSGKGLHEALEAVIDQFEMTVESLAEQLPGWFQKWSADRILIDVDFPASRTTAEI